MSSDRQLAGYIVGRKRRGRVRHVLPEIPDAGGPSSALCPTSGPWVVEPEAMPDCRRCLHELARRETGE